MALKNTNPCVGNGPGMLDSGSSLLSVGVGIVLMLKQRHRELPVCFEDAALVPTVH